MSLTHRFATAADVPLLAEWNLQLIQDERHRNPLTLPGLDERMRGWLDGEYTAVIFAVDGQPAAYALYRESEREVYLRQFFVRRDCRRRGIGRAAMSVLLEELWPLHKRRVVEVLSGNEPAIRFWRSVGYTDYSLTLEVAPRASSR